MGVKAMNGIDEKVLKILYLVPSDKMDLKEQRRREKIANQFLTNRRNKVFVRTTDGGPLSIESSIEESVSVPYMLQKIVKVQGTYDTVVIGCAGDTGIRPVREISSIPVVGPLESSIYFSLMLSDNFSIVTILDSMVPMAETYLRGLGIVDKCKSIRTVGIPVLELANDEGKLLDALVAARKQCKEDGARSIILGCMSMAFLLLDEKIEEDPDIPIINPAKVAIKAAELRASLGIRQSRISYPLPNIEKLKKAKIL